MVRPYLPLNALRAFEASARHLSFTRAAIELNVTQAAVSHQVKQLEARLKVALFKRLPRGLMMTAEGEALLPVMRAAFDHIAEIVERYETGRVREVLTIGAVGTFAVGWLLQRLSGFQESHPFVDVRLSTNNNRVDLAAEGLDYAIRFGDGAWHGTDSEHLFEAPLSPLCVPKLARLLKNPADLKGQTLLRSYRSDEWSRWFASAGLSDAANLYNTVVFDSSLAMIEAAIQGVGIALAPPRMFSRQLISGQLCQPFAIHTSIGSYWLTALKSRTPTSAMVAFADWIKQAASASAQ